MNTLVLLSLAVIAAQSGEQPVDVLGANEVRTDDASAATTGSIPDGWSPRIRLRSPDGWFAAPIHATLMPDGRVHFIGFERIIEDPSIPTVERKATFMIDPTPLGAPVPFDHTVTPLVTPLDSNNDFIDPFIVDDSLFCSGHTLTADGKLFIAGGTRLILDTGTNNLFTFGLSYSTLFDGTTTTRVPNDFVGLGAAGLNYRWYSTATRLPDRRILISGGYDFAAPTPNKNLSAEIYDPKTETYELFSDHTEAPAEIFNTDYTHAFVLPEPIGELDVVLFGEAGAPVLLSTSDSNSWTLLPNTRPDSLGESQASWGASSAMLPIRLNDGEWGYSNGSVAVASGLPGTSQIHHLDVFDTQNLSWMPRVDLGVMRHHPSTVLLPDGRVLIVAGHNLAGTANLRRNAYFDPRNPRGTRLGASFSDELRGYHHVALLLPDGRVLVGGGRDKQTSSGILEKTDMRYYMPSYMFEPNRPKIVSAPKQLRVGKSFTLQTNRRVREVVLMALGSMTHSIDMNQRSVQLAKQATFKVPGGFSQTVTAPPDTSVAPPGYYMLFALDNRRVPSEAVIVKLN